MNSISAFQINLRGTFGILVCATFTVWWIVERSGLPHHLASTLIFSVSALKVRLVAYKFMELQAAPFGLRLLLDIWLFACLGGLLAACWVS